MNNKNKKLSFSKIILSAVLAYLLCFLVIFACAALIKKTGSIPGDALSAITTCAISFSTIIATFGVCLISKSNGLITGIVSGAVIFLIMILIGLALGNKTDAPALLAKGAAIIAAGGIGGVLGVNKKSKV
ncbi:MAG: TIGR04086 family membrane protein [Clostridiales bacterium]|nr:TIGR04086 family membrane protein [Clostridiales bacterium]